jgi:hypothetical protein
MLESLDRLVRAARQVLQRPIHFVRRAEWEAKVRSGGEPTRLPAPLTPFANVGKRAPVLVNAMSTPPFASPGGFHVVRLDLADAPNVINTDSYDEIDLSNLPEWPRILAAAGLDDIGAEWALVTYVFLDGPKRRADHHSTKIPADIDGAEPK